MRAPSHSSVNWFSSYRGSFDAILSRNLSLILTLSELEQLRTQTQTAQSESATAASQTAAMMSLNLKLQSTASKNQARMIELEVKKQEAREARELLSIVQVRLQSCLCVPRA